MMSTLKFPWPGRLVPVLSLFVAVTVAAQDKPDFSGRWLLVTSGAGPDVARSLTVHQPIVRTNVYGAPIPPFFKELSVEREFVTGLRTDTYQIGVEGGTIAGVNRGAAPNVKVSQTRSSVRWEDNRLMIETGSYSGPTRDAGPYTEHTEVWQLDAEGMLMLAITDRGSGIVSTMTTLKYRKN